jgi:hypothetical protein
MPVDELLSSDNRDFAHEIARQAAGGVDLAAVAAQAGFESPPSTPRSLIRDRATARQAVESASSRQAELEQRRAGLQARRSELADLDRQLAEMEDLRRAAECLVAQTQRDQARQHVDAFDPRLAALSGRETGELQQLDAALAQLRRQLTEHERTRSRLIGDIECLHLPAAARSAHLPSLEAVVAALAHAEQAARDAHSQATLAVRQLEQATRNLRDAPTASGPASITPALLSDADALFSDALTVKATQSLVEAEENRLGTLAPPDDSIPAAERIQQAVTALALWLRSSPPTSPAVPAATFPIQSLAWICGSIVLISALAAIFWKPAMAAGAAGALLLFVAVLLLRPRPGPTTPPAGIDAALVHQDTFRRLRLPEPAHWNPESVGNTLSDLVGQWLRRAELDDAARARNALEPLRSRLSDQRAHWARRTAAFKKDHGMDVPEDVQSWIRLLIEKIRVWQEAVHRAEPLRAAAADADATLARAQLQCRTLFDSAGCDLTATLGITAKHAETQLADLRQRRTQWSQGERQLQEWTAAEPALRDQLGAAEKALSDFWQRMGLPPDDRTGLARLLETRTRWTEAADTLRAAEIRFAQTEADLGSARPWLDQGLEPIRSRLAERRDLQTRRDALVQAMTRLQADMEAAQQGHDLSDALEGFAAANALLMTQEERNVQQAIGHALFRWLRHQARDTMAPRVLTRAQQLLTRITRGRLSFTVEDSDDGPRFSAATGSEARRPVQSLSSGERVQLLMAVRLAFLEENEDRPLPLLLDEVLAASDDERTLHIIQTVIEIARTGRQVFYFTAQADEVAKWRSALAESGVDFAEFDLHTLRGMAESAARPLPAPPLPRPTPPEPGALSHHEYGKQLGVPGLNPWDPDSLHIWHVIEDVHVLHRVLRSGVERVGPLLRLIRQQGYRELGETQSAVVAIAEAFESACKAWSAGRGRPVTPEALIHAKAITPVFRERVNDLVARVSGDSRELLRQLSNGEIKGWREKSTHELREFLLRQGCLDESERLTTDGIRETVIASISRAGASHLVSGTTLDRVMASVPTP